LLIENFVEEQFFVEDGNNESVIDIGANRADSSLYFASKNYKVFGFEPIEQVFNDGLKNIDLNKHLKSKIELINKAISCKNGKTKIFFSGDINSSSGEASKYLDAENFQSVETITIDSILNDYNIEPYMLKMDCEGCEYDILLCSDLSMFKIILLEYHGYLVGENPEILFEELENQGFKMVKNTVLDDKKDLGVCEFRKTF
jgi:FkbM family methyltransferase